MKKIAIALTVLIVLFSISACAQEPLPQTTEPSVSMDCPTPSIETIVRTIKDQNFETLAAFDADGRLLLEITDHDSQKVTMTAEQIAQFREQGGALIIHNHPSGNSFSAQDLYTEAMRGTQRAIVVTRDYLYILSPGWQGWGDPDRLRDAHDKYSVEFEQLAETEDWRSTSARNRWVSDQAVAAVASDFGLDYWKIPVKDLFCFHGIQVVTAE